MKVVQVRKVIRFKFCRCEYCKKLRIMKYYGWDEKLAEQALEDYRGRSNNHHLETDALGIQLKKSEVYFCSKDCAVVCTI